LAASHYADSERLGVVQLRQSLKVRAPVLKQIGQLGGDTLDWDHFPVYTSFGKQLITNPDYVSEYKHRLGRKRYYLKNHLGNVLATVSDKKEGKDWNSDDSVEVYWPQVMSVQGYYPFGMAQPGRQFNPTETAYGFNGKRSDDEIYGVKNFYNYGKRMYDPRLARFPSADPLIIKQQKFPFYSPYQFAGNKPIVALDLEGLQEYIIHQDIVDQGDVLLTTVKAGPEFGEENPSRRFDLIDVKGREVEDFQPSSNQFNQFQFETQQITDKNTKMVIDDNMVTLGSVTLDETNPTASGLAEKTMSQVQQFKSAVDNKLLNLSEEESKIKVIGLTVESEAAKKEIAEPAKKMIKETFPEAEVNILVDESRSNEVEGRPNTKKDNVAVGVKVEINNKTEEEE
jgi:RHS repeat-associated protein